MVVMGKGNVKIKVNEIVSITIEVFYVPDLKDNGKKKVLQFLYKKEDVGFIILTKS